MTHSKLPFSLSLISIYCGLALISSNALAEQKDTDKSTESIQIIGKKHQNTSAPSGQSEFIDFSEFAPNVVNLSELVANTPGAELNGQGGLFQVYSLRGMSRWRVLTQYAGTPINTERRAGTAASFISPWLMGQVEVLKGPVSTLYGSGGMAGVTQISPRQFDGTFIETSFGSDNHTSAQNIGWGNDNISLGLSHRSDEDSYTPSGERLNSHFTQTSGQAIFNWAFNDEIDSQILVFSSKGTDIGKANNEDFINSKYTIYPDETHHILQWGLVAQDDWQARVSVHKQDLSTEVTRFDKRINTVDNKASDYSMSFIKQWQYNDLNGQWGVEQEYRTGIDAKEREESLTGGTNYNYHLLAASQLNSAAFANINYDVNNWSFTTGARFSYLNQKTDLANDGDSKSTDTAVTGFASAAYKFNDNWKLNSAISTGFRFPTVTERFFNGTTARGITLGNADLEAETATNFELGLAFANQNIQWQVNAFTNEINDYIERVNIDDETRTYINLDSGTIRGIEMGFDFQVSDSFSYSLSGHSIEGEDQDGATLADISANKLQLGLNYNQQNWQAKMTIKHRFAQNNVVAGDQPLAAVDIVNMNVRYDLSEQWQLSFWGNNLLNKEYVLTSDSKSALSAERQWGISVLWQMD